MLPLFVHARQASLAPVEGRRWNYVVCCVKPVPKFLRARSVTATRHNSLVMLARTGAAAHSQESSHRLIRSKAGQLIGSYLRFRLGNGGDSRNPAHMCRLTPVRFPCCFIPFAFAGGVSRLCRSARGPPTPSGGSLSPIYPDGTEESPTPAERGSG